MLQFATKYFGLLECAEDAIFDFPEGLPGFEEDVQFVLLDQPDQKPLVFMQSVRRQDVCFLALPVFLADPNYSLSMPSDDLAVLGLAPDRQPRIGEDVLCLVLLTVIEGVAPTVNLRSPIIVNLKNQKGLQSIQLNSDYPFQSSLLAQKESLPC
jgi:flagellar assembly factor FliW